MLRIQIDETPESLSPQEARSLSSLTVTNMIYDGLTRISPDGNWVASVAERINISDDGLVYTFELRETQWTDGTEVTALDFVRGWEHAQETHHAPLFEAIETFERVRPHTLRVRLNRPAPYLPYLVAHPAFFPEHPKGKTNGPFQVKRIRPDSEIELVKSRTYWDKGAVQLDGIRLAVIPDDATALYLHYRSELDWVGSPFGNIPAEQLTALRKKGQLKSYPVAATYWLKINTRVPPFTNAKIRKAFSNAIDRTSLVERVVPLGQASARGVLPPSMSKRTVPLLDQHGSRSTELLQEGLNELGLTEMPPITLTASNNERYQKLAQAIQEQWRANLGVDVKIQGMEFKSLLAQMAAQNYQIAGKVWFADYNDPATFLEPYREPNSRLNETGWHHEAYVNLLDQATMEPDAEKRRRILLAAEELLIEEMPIIPVCHHAMCYLANDEVIGTSLPPIGCADYKWASILILEEEK